MTKLKVPAKAITKFSYDSLKILFLLQNSENSFFHTLIVQILCHDLFFRLEKEKNKLTVFRKSSDSRALLLRNSQNLHEKTLIKNCEIGCIFQINEYFLKLKVKKNILSNQPNQI